MFKLHSLVLIGKKKKIVKYNIGLSFQSQRFSLFLVLTKKNTFLGKDKDFLWLI